MNLPAFENYGHYSSNNYGVNTLKFHVGNLVIWFSYKTPVAFRGNGHGLTVRQNDWGATTGKHLNWIDGGDKEHRIPGDEFERLLEQATKCD